MEGNRKAADSARSGKHAGTSRAAEPNVVQLRRLRQRASALAVAVSVLAIFPISAGFQLSTIFAIPITVAVALLFLFANLRTARTMHRNGSPPTIPMTRIALSVGGALIVMYAAIFWAFRIDIEAAQVPVDIASWQSEIQDLQQERDSSLQIAGRGLPTVDQDPDVIRLRRQIDDAVKEFREAKRNELCELDGTCGTGIPGVGKAYYEKAGYSAHLDHKITGFSTELAVAETASTGRIEQIAKEQSATKGRAAEIDGQLERLRSNPPDNRGTARALYSVAGDRPAATILVSTGTFGAFLAVDLLVFYWIARRIYRRPDERSEFRDRVHQKSRIDDQRARGVKQAGEYLSGEDGA